MERTGRNVSRENQALYRKSRQAYVEGNTARRLQERTDARRPAHQRPMEYERRSHKQNVSSGNRTSTRKEADRRLSNDVIKNREKALKMNAGFVIFLMAISVSILYTGVNYLQLRFELTSITRTAASLEMELSQLKDENDAYYSHVTSQTDLGEIKKKAIGSLGMRYPTEEQTMTYETEGGSYVKQYQDVPSVK